MIELIKSVNTYTKKSFGKDIQIHSLLAKDYKKNKLVLANTNSKELRNELVRNQIKTTECSNGDLEKVFFSDENIDLINKQLII